MKLSLRQLEIFAAVAKTENVSLAAARLAMSQSAASSALLELERLYDCPLFDRIGKSLHLNSTGRGLLPMAEALIAQSRDIEDYLSGGRPGPLNIGATLTIGNYLATLIVVDYKRQFPDAPVQLQVANTDTVVERLLRFECDLGLIEGEVSHPDLIVEPWLADELVVFCAPGHALAHLVATIETKAGPRTIETKAGPRTIETKAGPRTTETKAGRTVDRKILSEQSWILREPGSGTRSQFDRCIGSQLLDFRLGLELEHTEAIKRAVESGLGVGCLSRLALREAFRRGSLVEVPTPQFDLHRHFYFVSHRRRNPGTAVRLFRQACFSAMYSKNAPAPSTCP
jgi:DNA-binding transcriptional LysR family regulator